MAGVVFFEGPANVGQAVPNPAAPPQPRMMTLNMRSDFVTGTLLLPYIKDDWIRAQNDYAQNRRAKLNALYCDEINQDVEILKKPWMYVDSQVPSATQDRFRTQSLLNNLATWGQRGILQEFPLVWLIQYATAYMKPEDKSNMFRLAGNEGYLTGSHLTGWDRDEIELSQLDELMNTKYDRDGTMHYLRKEDPEVIRLGRAYELMNRLRLMRRLADGRNLVVSEAPLPDGSNFEPHNHFLAATWILHRCYIRLLHQRSLHVGESKQGEHMLELILGLSMCFLDLESRNIPHDPISQQQNFVAFNLITSLYRQLLDALTEITREAEIETRLGVFSREETLTHNARTRLGEILDRHLPPALSRWYLWDDILDANQHFNICMNKEHVEDKRTDKQVVLIDEEYEVLDKLRTQGYAYVTPRIEPPVPELSDEELELTIRPQKYIRKLAEINQLRRNLLLLKDWNRKRPWKQLYCPYNTTAEGDYGPDSTDKTRRGFWDEIRLFKLHLTDQHFFYPQQDPTNFNPSNHANIYSSLFPIHPTASHALPREMQQDDWDAGCPICSDEWDKISRKLFAQLHCGHFFHYTCLRSYWDEPDNITFKCPTCRQNDWILREKIGVSAEVNDVFDYERSMGAQTGSYVFDAYYHDKEELLIEKSQEYDLLRGGYPTSVEVEDDEGNFTETWEYRGDEKFSRRPDTEMAIMREYRRIRNRLQKASMADAKVGISALDPPDPNPDGVPPPFVPEAVTVNPDKEAERVAEVERVRQEAERVRQEEERVRQVAARAVARAATRAALDQMYLDQESDSDEEVGAVDQSFRNQQIPDPQARRFV
ncbi:hypothetical protein VTL71DRAFT_4293 [Oculimacula yallundae]|uniref:RING-type domain-containing protein n=1 Tax=Oculimacula yallundae TaxID=86028 RepID=A0ABR4C5D2_9HELO